MKRIAPTAPMIATPPIAAPMPMPALAPAESPPLLGGGGSWPGTVTKTISVESGLTFVSAPGN